MADDEIWMWVGNLSWQLFSSAIYFHRLSIFEIREQKRHAYLKNVILNSFTAVEAFINEILINEKRWDEKKLKQENIEKKLREFGVDLQSTDLRELKFIRNDFIIHHKRRDAKYFVEINDSSALDAIESSQHILALVAFNHKRMFPYWITGLNFINPIDNDIIPLNEYEFWSRLKNIKVNRLIDDIVNPSGQIIPLRDQDSFISLYKEIWENVRRSNFKLEIHGALLKEKFPNMPILTANWWS